MNSSVRQDALSMRPAFNLHEVFGLKPRLEKCTGVSNFVEALDLGQHEYEEVRLACDCRSR